MGLVALFSTKDLTHVPYRFLITGTQGSPLPLYRPGDIHEFPSSLSQARGELGLWSRALTIKPVLLNSRQESLPPNHLLLGESTFIFYGVKIF